MAADDPTLFDFPMSAGLRRSLAQTGIRHTKQEGTHTMGMFTAPEIFSDHFKEGEPFTLEAARVGEPIQTDYGEGSPALLKIGGKWFSVFGQGLVMQIQRMEDGDLPAKVALRREPTRGGNAVKKLVPWTGGDGEPAQEPKPEDDIPF